MSMQAKLSYTEPESEIGAKIEIARERLDKAIGNLNLPPEDSFYLSKLFDIYRERPISSAEAFSHEILSYVRSCLLQIYPKNKGANEKNHLKRFGRQLEAVQKSTLFFSVLVSGNGDLDEYIEEPIEEETQGKGRTGKRANDLDGGTWLKYSVSVWDDLNKTADEYSYGHPAMFPSELPDRLIQMFTTKNFHHTILDPFMGSGSTLVASVNNDKRGVGFEIYENFIELAEKRLTGTFNFSGGERDYRIIKDDARNLRKYLDESSVDMCITSPPYWNILTQKRTADYKEVRRYGTQDVDLGEISDYEDFLSALKNVFAEVYYSLKPESYCIVNVMDLRKQSTFYPYHIDVVEMMRKVGFELDDIIIWNRGREYNNLRPLGYPFVFRVNKVHEFILVFKARKPNK